MENEQLRITLDKPDKIYFAGQTIKGDIVFNLTKRTKIRAIKVGITGKGKCNWSEILGQKSARHSSRTLFYSSKEIYAHCENSLAVFEPRGVELGCGEHTFNFEMPLDWNLPSSFKGNYGSIKYKLRILIQRPWPFFDGKHTIPVTVVKHMPMTQIYRSNPVSTEKQITKTISLFGTRPITMLAILPEDSTVRGEPLQICVTVDNRSTTNVEKLRFKVFQQITYFSQKPLSIQKMECVAIATKETGAVDKKSERSFAHEILIPATAQPTDNDLSRIINVAYELRVEAVFRGFFKNLVLNLPFKIFSNLTDNNGEPIAAPMQPPPPSPPIHADRTGAGNPFETPSGDDSSIAASIVSPTHSSQYSESSSLRSITSDSSAATLSPAVGGGGAELSYASGTSSQFNSPSARASLRSSNVPYVAYSNSPLMINSYPPPHMTYPMLPESTQYVLMTTQPLRATPPPGMSMPMPMPSSSNTHPTSLGSFLHGLHPPQRVRELPPSYEELFGNASAPPASPK